MTALLADNGGGLMRPPLRLAASLVALLIALCPLAARADDAATAREHYQKGTSNYDLGRYADAIKEFEAAYEIKNDPALRRTPAVVFSSSQAREEVTGAYNLNANSYLA